MQHTLWLGLLLVAGLLGEVLEAQDQAGVPVKPIPAAVAGNRVGESVAVVGVVAEVHRTEKVIHLNFGAKFPKQTFTAVVFPARFNVFTNVAGLEGRTVEVSGKVADYRGRPQIVLETKSQLRIVEPKEPPNPAARVNADK
jgi:hypothetical protein